MKFGIRAKVVFSILTLITVIIVSIGVFNLITQSNYLKKNIVDNAESDARTFGSIAAPAILEDDDLPIADMLGILKNKPGFVYGRAIGNARKRNIVELFSDQYNDKKEIFASTIELNEEFWKRTDEMEKGIIDVSEIQIKGEAGSFFNIYLPVYNQFIPDSPPLGVVHIIISDEVIRKSIEKNIQGLILSGVLFWLIGGFGTYLLSSAIVKPINRLVSGAKKVGEGNLDYKVPVTSEDELGLLARQFNTMTDGLKTAQKNKQEQAVMDDQIRQAKEIQEGMNPMNLLDTDIFQIKGYTRAAKGVGGDYFDFQELPDGKLALLITDVSGKSISASLVMVLIKTVVATYMQLFDFIRSDIILTIINKVMASQAHIDKFATGQFIIYDPPTGRIEFSNGGQGPLFVLRGADKVCTESKQAGLPLGIDEDNEYRVSAMNLHSGDMIILYTDGITEAWDKEKNEYGMERFREKIIQYTDDPVDKIVDTIIKDIDSFADGMEQHDDMTLVVMKVK